MMGVTLENVSKSYGVTSVISNVNVRIEPGELFFLLGPSGCGKTTLLRMIAGFVEPTAGNIFFGDKNVRDVPPNRRNTGMVFQNYALWPHMTVAENIAFGLDVRQLPHAQKKKRVQDALALVRMPGYESRYPQQLSGGQQQRVALARALVIKPDVVLLDEPLSNLDAGLRIEMRKEIHRIHEELDVTMIYVTHDQKEALSLATRIAVVNQGTVVQTATPAELYQNPLSVFVAKFVGETNVVFGRVSAVTQTSIDIVTPAGHVVCPIARAVRSFAAGEDVALSIRPEGIALAHSGSAGDNKWRALVAESTYLGEIVQVVCNVGDVAMRVTELNPAGAPPRPGEQQNIVISPSHVRILEPEGANEEV